jgi:hydroxymethylbilane synthase
MKNGHCDAMIMASAGLTRLGMQGEITDYFEPEIFLPAPAQGAIAIQIKINDTEIESLVKQLNDKNTETCVTAERAFLNKLEGGCQLPVGALAKIENGEIILDAMIASTDGKNIIRDTMKGEDPVKLGRTLADLLYNRGGDTILAQCKIGK